MGEEGKSQSFCRGPGFLMRGAHLPGSQLLEVLLEGAQTLQRLRVQRVVQPWRQRRRLELAEHVVTEAEDFAEVTRVDGLRAAQKGPSGVL